MYLMYKQEETAKKHLIYFIYLSESKHETTQRDCCCSVVVHHNVFLALFSLHTKTTFVSKQESPAATVLLLPTVYEYFRDLSTFFRVQKALGICGNIEKGGKGFR